MGYPFGKKGYKVYDLEYMELCVSRDVIFYEIILPYMTQNKSCKNHMQGSKFFKIENPTSQESSTWLVESREEVGHSNQAQHRTGHQEKPRIVNLGQ